MDKIKKIGAGILLTGTLATGGTVVADKTIDPYITRNATFEISKESVIPHVGEVRTEISKNKPSVKLTKWDGQTSMTVRYDDVKAIGKRALLTDRIEWKDTKQEVHAYPIQATSTMEDGGFEIEIILNEKPTTNIFNFPITGTENLDFLYQAPLWREAGLSEPTQNCTDTKCDESERPENVVGSYAVYFKDHQNHIEGQTNYATGKAYHIFRPQVIDAKGNKIWADLSYSNSVLTVNVPQGFLDTASYPVTVDPTFGYTTCGASSGGWAADQTVGSQEGPVTSVAGSVTNINLCSNGDGTGATSIKGYITTTAYAILAGSITSGQLITGPSATPTLLTITYSGPALTTATTYYPWIIGNGPWSTRQDTGGVSVSAFKTTGTTYASPSNPTAPTVQNVHRSIYATYVAASVPSGGNSMSMGSTTMTLSTSTLIIP